MCHGGTPEEPYLYIGLKPREKLGREVSIAGRESLIIINPPTLDLEIIACLLDVEIWGNATELRIGDIKWAERITYSTIRLVDDENT